MKEVKLIVIKDGEPTKPLLSAKEVYEEFKYLENELQEHFYIIHLNNRNKIIHKTLCTIGTATGSLCHPRDVFRTAIVENAISIMIVHNHPSGDPAPSTQDIEITKKLSEVGKIISINLLDHIIIGKHEFYSMRQAGYI